MDEGDTALLRAPPFYRADAAVSRRRLGAASPTTPDDVDRLFAEIRKARVGGTFWAPAGDRQHKTVIARVRTLSEIDRGSVIPGDVDPSDVVWILAEAARRTISNKPAASEDLLVGEFDPWSLLDGSVELVAHGDDEWIALAEIAGCRVHILSSGRFGEPDETFSARRRRIAADLAHCDYCDPFTGEVSGIEATVAQLADWRRIFDENRDIVAGCGIAWWKREEIAQFLQTAGRRPRFFWSERRAIADAARRKGAVAVWPSRVSENVGATARQKSIPLVRIEDGFIRSVGLGSDLVPPSSVTVDWQGIHYDPTRPSDLETMLAEYSFSPALLARADRLRHAIIAAGIGKYGSENARIQPQRQADRKVVLVPGQVEDDMSVRLGGCGLASNLELLRRARSLESDAEIWFRPHPDVDAGHRKGVVRDSDALRYADRVVRGGGMAGLLAQVDAVHVLTSLTGFEALMRNAEVTCHGNPFFAGWGLTRDLAPPLERRGRRLTIDQLVAAVLILYPRYLDPVTGLPCPPELLITRMKNGVARNRLGWITPVRQFQGRLSTLFARRS